MGECADGLEAAASIASLQPDAVFLDIQMPGMSGLEVAAQLESAQAPLLVFVTAYDEHAIKAFDLNAIDYLLKPYDKERLHKTLERLRERCGEALAKAPSAIRTHGRRPVPPNACWCRRASSCSSSTRAPSTGSRPTTTTSTCTPRRRVTCCGVRCRTCSCSSVARFMRIHKSAAVNIAEVKSLSPLFKGDHEVHLRSGAVLRLSRRYKDELFARIGG